MDGLTGKTIKEAEVDGFGIRMVFTDGAVFDYDASDGGYSQYELTEATADAMQKQIDHVAESDKKVEQTAEIAQNVSDSDLIYRKAAIDVICAICGNDCDKSEFIYNAPQTEQVIPCPEHYGLSTLPSAQPEIIRCKDCKFSHMTNDGRYCKYCDQFTDDYGELVEMYFDSDFYCGYAERRTDEVD